MKKTAAQLANYVLYKVGAPLPIADNPYKDTRYDDIFTAPTARRARHGGSHQRAAAPTKSYPNTSGTTQNNSGQESYGPMASGYNFAPDAELGGALSGATQPPVSRGPTQRNPDRRMTMNDPNQGTYGPMAGGYKGTADPQVEQAIARGSYEHPVSRGPTKRNPMRPDPEMEGALAGATRPPVSRPATYQQTSGAPLRNAQPSSGPVPPAAKYREDPELMAAVQGQPAQSRMPKPKGQGALGNALAAGGGLNVMPDWLG